MDKEKFDKIYQHLETIENYFKKIYPYFEIRFDGQVNCLTNFVDISLGDLGIYVKYNEILILATEYGEYRDYYTISTDTGTNYKDSWIDLEELLEIIVQAIKDNKITKKHFHE